MFIYGLQDPRTTELKYVGVTSNLGKRLREHRHTNRITRVTSWIKSLKKQHLDPQMFVIETVPDEEWAEVERFWIGYFRMIGAKLLNLTDGGEQSTRGFKLSAEHRAKLSAAKKGRKFPNMSAGQKKRFETDEPWNKGKPMSDETKAKVSASKKGQPAWNKGIPLSPETKEKIGKAVSKQHHSSPEVRAKISESQKRRFAQQRENNKGE